MSRPQSLPAFLRYTHIQEANACSPVDRHACLHNILIKRLMKYEADKWTTTGPKTGCSKGCDQQHKFQQEASHLLVDYPREQDWRQCCSTFPLMMWMMGQSAPSASLPITQTWEVQFIHQESRLPFRGPSTGWKNGLRIIS